MTDSNPRPTDYKSVALPTELIRHITAAAAPCTSASSPLIEFRTGTNFSKANPFTQHLKSYWIINFIITQRLTYLATLTGVEPVTSSVTGWHSNHLNYKAIIHKESQNITTLYEIYLYINPLITIGFLSIV